MRACVRVRPVVGGARLPVDYTPTVLSSSRGEKSKRRIEKVATRVWSRASIEPLYLRRYFRGIRRYARRAVAIWSHGRVTR